MQAFFIFVLIFFEIFGAAVFVRLLYNALINEISKKRKGRKRGGKYK